MIVVINQDSSLSIIYPIGDIKNIYEKLDLLKSNYFNTDFENLPPRKDKNTGECFRCSWVADTIFKKVSIKQPCICIHNELLKLNNILDDPLTSRQDKLNAMLDIELLRRSNRGK